MNDGGGSIKTPVTLKDISERTGFTINTVSRALKDKPDISESTVKLIKKAAKDMGYIGNSIAGALRSGLTNTIAVILGDITNPHFSIMIKEIERVARTQKYTTFILNTDENEELEKAIMSALAKMVDGIIICPTQKSSENILFLKKTNIPFVLIGRHFSDIDTDYVVCDDVNGGYLATKHLISIGHKRILFLNGPLYISSAIERLEGYKKACAEAKIPYESDLVCEVSITAGENWKTIKDIIESGIKFSAIVAFSDMIAWEMIHILDTYGYTMSSDYDIVGFDNIQSKLMFPINLTSVMESKIGMSQRAFKILLKKINKQSVKPVKEIVSTQIIIRDSTAKK